MFGIAKISPSATLNQQEQFRLHYCGTCKSIAKLYGHKSRFFTNYDTAFLAEILSNFGSRENWEKSFEPYNCFKIPTEREIPEHLKYAACISLLLADLKMEDNIIDNKQKFLIWKITKNLLSKEFSSAQKQLVRWGVPVKKIWELFHKQLERENKMLTLTKPMERLLYFSEATSEITGLVFKYGAIQIGAINNKDTMYVLGYYFGRIAYILDAFEDFDKDMKNKSFNAIQAAYKDQHLTETIENEVINLLNNTSFIVKREMFNLPISYTVAEGLNNRVVENMKIKLEKDSYNKIQVPALSVIRINWKEKIIKSFALSRHISLKNNPDKTYFNKFMKYINLPLIFLFFTLTPYRIWGQGGSNNGGGGICLLICIAMAFCGGKEYIVEKDCCGNERVREKTCCDG